MNNQKSPVRFQISYPDPKVPAAPGEDPVVKIVLPGGRVSDFFEGVRRQGLDAGLGEIVNRRMADAESRLVAAVTHSMGTRGGSDAAKDAEVLRALARVVAPPPPSKDLPPRPREEPLITTIDGYAHHRAVSRSTVNRWLKLGMPHERLGPRLVRIRIADADKWLDGGGPKLAVKRAAVTTSRTKDSETGGGE